ncbi:conserved membrane hypothetical protein [Gammaproteobacteria bacterium]
MMPVFSYQRLNILEVWLTSWRLYCKTFSQVWFLTAIIGVLVNTLIIFGMLYPLKFQTITMGAAIIYVVMTILVQLLNIYLFAVVLHRMQAVGDWQNLTLWDSLCYVNKKYSKIVIADFFAYFFVLLGLFLLIVPGVYVIIAILMVKPLILFDNRGSFASLKDSFLLVNGNWWRTFVIFFLPKLIVLHSFYFGLFASYYFSHKVWYVLMGYNTLITIFLFPLIIACILVQFKDLKLRRQ